MKTRSSRTARFAQLPARALALIPVLLLSVAPSEGLAQQRAMERPAGAAEAMTAAVEHLILERDLAEVPFVLLPLGAEDRDLGSVGADLETAARLLGVEAVPDRTHYVCTEELAAQRVICSYPEGRRSVLLRIEIEGRRAVVEVARISIGSGSRPIREGRFYVIGSEEYTSVHLAQSAAGAWVVSEVGQEISGLMMGEVGTPR